MAATYDSFASSRFNKFIPYTPPQPRTSRRAVSKELDTCDAEWTDIDELIKNLADHDYSLDKFAAAPLLHTRNTGNQVEEQQNMPERIEENDGNGIPVENGMHSSVGRPSVPTLSSKNDAPVLHATPDEDETCVTKHHDHHPGSPDTTMHSADDTILEPVTQLNRVDERLDGSSFTEPVHALHPLQAWDERQNIDTGETMVRTNGGVMKRKNRSDMGASDGHIDSKDGSSSPSEPSAGENEIPSSPENSVSDAWLSANLSEESADEEPELHQAKRVRWQGKQRRFHRREKPTPSTTTKRRRPSHTRSNIPPERSSQRSSERLHLDTAADASQSLLDYDRTDVRPVPQKLTQITLRQLASGETFMAAVIQDERKVASFAYEQIMQMIRRSVACDQEIDKLAVMAVMLNSWLVTGFIRPADQHSRGQTIATERVTDLTEESLTAVASKSHTECIDPETGLGNLIDEAVFLAGERDGTAEDDLYSTGSESDKPKVNVRRRRRPWKTSEEDILRKHAKHKSWGEIGELLKRTPGGVFQHWRLMQQGLNRTDKKRKSRQRKRRCLDSDSDSYA